MLPAKVKSSDAQDTIDNVNLLRQIVSEELITHNTKSHSLSVLSTTFLDRHVQIRARYPLLVFAVVIVQWVIASGHHLKCLELLL